MNAKQALRGASKRIEELEDFNQRASAEIKALNKCIDSVIAGEKTYCDWCEDQEECQRECKGHGCSEWWIAMNPNDRPELTHYFVASDVGADDASIVEGVVADDG